MNDNNIIKFDEKNESVIPYTDLLSLRDFIEKNILKKNGQSYLKYVDWMTIKSLVDILKFEDESGIPGFIGIKRKTSLDYLTSIQEKCYDRRYEYKKISSLFENKKVLDIGCKYGDFSLYVKGEYTGIDINEGAIEEAKRIGIGNFIVGDFLDINLDEKNYDIVVLSHILEHYTYEECKKFLNKAFSLSDMIFVSIPQWFERKKGHKQSWDSRESFENLFNNDYSLNRLKETEVFSFNYFFMKKDEYYFLRP